MRRIVDICDPSFKASEAATQSAISRCRLGSDCGAALFDLALGYDNVNDHDQFRDGGNGGGRVDLTGWVRERDRGHPLAGSSA